MYSILIRFLFGPSEPPPITKLAQVCDKNKILTDKTAEVVQKTLRLLKPKEYVVFNHCSTKECRFINLSYVDEENLLYHRTWPNEKEAVLGIKQFTDLGYAQVTMSKLSLRSKKL